MAVEPEDYQQDPVRLRLYRKLGFERYLQQRRCWKVGSLPLHCDVYGADPEAPTILFLPGIGTYVELYCELLAKLQQQGFNVVGMDLRGHGYSGGERGYYKVEEIIADAAAVINEIQTHFKGPIGLFGCSMGARLALAITEADERIQSLLCHTLFLAERPPDFWHQFGWQSLSYTAFFFPDFKVNFRTFVDVDSLLANNPMAEMADQDPLLVWDYPVGTLDSLYSYRSQILNNPLRAKTAVIVGSEDQVLTPQYIQSIIKDSQQPFTYIEIPEGSHMLPFDHINDTLKACSDWFKQTLR